MGTVEDQETAFPPHKVIGNIYYVGTRTLSSFLVTTPAGHILIDTTYERNARVIQKSIEQLGFKVSDIRIILGNHAHGDHQEGDAVWKEMSGAQVMAMAEDIPALTQIMPGGKPHPIDRVLHDGDKITLGDTTLIARLTAGHTRGATAYTMTAVEAEKRYDVVFFSSLRAPGTVTPAIAAEFDRTFPLVRSLPCDIPLGDHPSEYGGPRSFTGKTRCFDEVDIQEAMYRAIIGR